MATETILNRKALRDYHIVDRYEAGIELQGSEVKFPAILSLQLPKQFCILFDPVTHSTHFINVQGNPVRERQNLTIVFSKLRPTTGNLELRPGPLRLLLDLGEELGVPDGHRDLAGKELQEILVGRVP